VTFLGGNRGGVGEGYFYYGAPCQKEIRARKQDPAIRCNSVSLCRKNKTIQLRQKRGVSMKKGEKLKLIGTTEKTEEIN